MAKKKWNGFDPDKRINPDDFLVRNGEVLDKERYMANKKADFKLDDVKVPKTGVVPPAPASEINISTDTASRMNKLFWKDLDSSPTQRKICETLEAMTDLLLYKNQKYGDSALNPIGIFTKHIKGVDEKTASILVRIDDKLSRVKNADTLRTNDICNLIGYLTLLNIAIGTTAEDIAKFKD